jgi:hypothetical protein
LLEEVRIGDLSPGIQKSHAPSLPPTCPEAARTRCFFSKHRIRAVIGTRPPHRGLEVDLGQEGRIRTFWAEKKARESKK